MSRWVFGKFYSFKTRPSEFVVSTLDSGTRKVEVMCEVVGGDMAGEKLKFTGFLNSVVSREKWLANAARALKDLQAMGIAFPTRKWSEPRGVGSGYIFEAKVMSDEAKDGSGRVFARLAFPQEVRRLNRDQEMNAAELDRLDDEMPIDQLEKVLEAEEHDRKNEQTKRRNSARQRREEAAYDDEVPFEDEELQTGT